MFSSAKPLAQHVDIHVDALCSRDGTMRKRCTHLDQVRAVEPRTPQGCEECLQSGDRWVHLRMCLTCGHVGCCDSSPNKHATRHFHATEHPIIASFQPGEKWAWCYVDELMMKSPRAGR